MSNAAEIAAKISPLERDYLLDFAGLETGKVCAGAAMWEIAKDFQRIGLMAGWPNCQITELGRDVATRLQKDRV